jgi:dTDP-4-dehydrorhamnose reductase
VSTPRILVVGATGMLGHEALRVLAPEFEVWGACRDAGALPDLGVPAERILAGLDATDRASAYALVEYVRPDLVLNAVGIVKQRAEAQSPLPSISVNSLWPHVLADACATHGARMVHVSTDCVFSGARGGYVESDVPDASDLYGRSKLLGEVVDRDNVVTLRTSIVGWELGDPTGLVGWFAVHRGEALKGYTKAVFSGLTTHALTDAIRDVVVPDEGLSGLWHVSADPIDKCTLLTMLAGHLGWDVDLSPVDQPVIDRSLDCMRFRKRTGWTPPSWGDMLHQLALEHPDPADSGRS